MKRSTTFGFAALAALAIILVAAAGASATTLCKESKMSGDCASVYGAGTELEASVESSTLLKTSGGTTIDTCTGGKLTMKTGNTGSTTETVNGNVLIQIYETCTSTTHVLANGSLEIHQIAGTNNGTLTSTGTEVTIDFLGVSCIFKTSATDIGTLTGGAPATFDVNGNIPSNTGGLCPAGDLWSGAYSFTKPTTTLDFAAG